MKTLSLDNIKTGTAFQAKTEFPHKHDLVRHSECPVETCNDGYTGVIKKEIKRKEEHPCPQYQNLKIISSGFRKQTGEIYSSKVF